MQNEVIELLPDDLLIALRASKEESWVCAGSPEIRKIFDIYVSGGRLPESEIETAKAHITKWIEQQKVLQDDAAETIRALSDDSMIDPSTGALAAWITEPWSLGIRSPWSDNLAMSIFEAKEWIATHG